jgi:hypothetical protein
MIASAAIIYGDDDDDPDADGSDHPTTLATISPRLACAKP